MILNISTLLLLLHVCFIMQCSDKRFVAISHLAAQRFWANSQGKRFLLHLSVTSTENKSQHCVTKNPTLRQDYSSSAIFALAAQRRWTTRSKHHGRSSRAFHSSISSAVTEASAGSSSSSDSSWQGSQLHHSCSNIRVHRNHRIKISSFFIYTLQSPS